VCRRAHVDEGKTRRTQVCTKSYRQSRLLFFFFFFTLCEGVYSVPEESWQDLGIVISMALYFVNIHPSCQKAI
jgi:hypothetical protein